MNKRVSTQQNGNNLFQISGTTTLRVYHVLIGPLPFLDKKIPIGTANTLADALSIIKSFSGAQIKKISDW